MEYTNGLAKGEFLQHMYNKFPSAYENPHLRKLLENIVDYCTEDNFTHTKNELFYTLVKLIPDVEEKELLNYMDENSMTKETIESILEQNVSDGLEYENAKNAKTQVYFLQMNSVDSNNAVVLRQDDVALIMDTTSDGRFNGTVYDETVDLHQTDENGHIDTSRIKSELSENIGDGSGMYRFDQLVKESLNNESSQLTAVAWWEVNHPLKDTSFKNLSSYELVYVTNYDDVNLDEETRAQVILDKRIKRSVSLTSDFEHNMDSSTDYNKEFSDRFSAFPEDLERIKMWVSNQFNLNKTEMNNIVNSDEGKRLIILWQDISYYANASEFDENTIRREAYAYDPADPFTTATWPSPKEMRDDADYRNLIDQKIKAANKVVKNAKDFIKAYSFSEKFQNLAVQFQNKLQNKQSMKDKLADAQAKAAEKNHKRDQQEKDKVTPQR